MFKPFTMMLAATLGISMIPAAVANPIGFVQTNLASDSTDANLVNAWGIAASADLAVLAGREWIWDVGDL